MLGDGAMDNKNGYVRWPLLCGTGLALAASVFAAVAWMMDGHAAQGHLNAVLKDQYFRDMNQIAEDIRDINKKLDRLVIRGE